MAIALNSRGGKAQATQVIAKGTGEVAEQILQLAFEHGVKVRSDADLATILSAVEVESEIPLEALTAVANILSYIYRAEQPSAPESSS
ncbi:flagellar protein FhlB [Denitrobaculum tricleocarpae]|uniref:Flagellar protein FhlB n=1 Tax=Denitrobaculum tricleocarpae TaxID=2591009 RepID=A0A545T280_9PROT|nr:EscU/YscU/HrcU family type III secretion system export apparatus switch protein [Denitrobaculum tricleocarpae]TQV71321.1 flagellar protein FhlB [Denitrobaculum tricleocarpae]